MLPFFGPWKWLLFFHYSFIKLTKTNINGIIKTAGLFNSSLRFLGSTYLGTKSLNNNMISSAMKNVGQFSVGQLHCPTNLRIKRTICKIWLPIAEQKIPKSHAIAEQP